MPYFSYHNTAKKLIREGKLVSCFFTENCAASALPWFWFFGMISIP